MDNGTEFKGSFEALSKKKGIKTYSTESDKKSAFAKRNIRSLKNLIYKYLEDSHTLTNCKILSRQLNREQIVSQILHQTNKLKKIVLA